MRTLESNGAAPVEAARRAELSASSDFHQRATASGRDMPAPMSAKTRQQHWDRLAIVYIRQSSAQQVIENRESRDRQYALADRAVALGWPRDRVRVIDEDQGCSGRSAENRTGFQQLLVDVSLNQVGLILGLEMSRLARSNRDWHHLLEVCAVFGTLLADHDGVYDPTDINDRLLLGLKGTISEVELHTMRTRLWHGKLNKARRGELRLDAPRGYVRTAMGALELDPDEAVRSVIRLAFEKFDELKSVHAVVRYMAATSVQLPTRLRTRERRGELQWRAPTQSALRELLRHPIYAGAYCFGRHRVDPRRAQSGRRGSGIQQVAVEQAHVFLPDRTPAYISREQFERNQRQMAENRTKFNTRGTPRRGTALLAGLLICGRCGCRLRVCYSGRRPRYMCTRHQSSHGLPACQALEGDSLDELAARQVLRALEPAALELSLTAADAVEKDRYREETQWRLRRERAKYEAERARRQHDAVEPENRLVARELERRWEEALAQQRELDEEHSRWQRKAPARLSAEERARIEALAHNIPGLWHDSDTSMEDRKTIVRFLIERVVLEIEGASENVQATIHWAGGFESRHRFRRRVLGYHRLSNYEGLLARVSELRAAGRTRKEIARQLNAEGCQPPQRPGEFNAKTVSKLLSILRARQIEAAVGGGPNPTAANEPPGPDEWRARELADALEIPLTTLHTWRRRGWLRARKQRGWPDRWIYFANAAELDRLGRLRTHRRTTTGPYPAALTMPLPTSNN